MSRSLIYDTFTFFNELDLLELRLNEMGPVVDRFVLVEAPQTFQGQPKPLYYLENRERFRDFHDRIVHVVLNEFPPGLNSWQREAYQRACIGIGLKDCQPDDVILISDVDHILRPAIVDDCKVYEGPGNIALELWYFYYYFNYRCLTNDHTATSRLLRFRNYTDAQSLFRSEPELTIEDAGWHFSYLGGVEKIIEKLESFAHTEFNAPEFKDAEQIRRLVDAGQDLFGRPEYRFKRVELDASFPRFLVENLDQFSRYVKA